MHMCKLSESDFKIIQDAGTALYDHLILVDDLFNVEYDGKYGPCVYLTLVIMDDSENMIKNRLQVITEAITKFIDEINQERGTS